MYPTFFRDTKKGPSAGLVAGQNIHDVCSDDTNRISNPHQHSANIPNNNSNKFNIHSIIHLNIQSLTNKFPAVEVFVSEHQPTILGLTESWIYADQINMANLKGYVLVSHFSRSNHIHGGVVLFAKSDCQATSFRKAVDLSIEMHIECASILTKIDNVKVCIVMLYRPPEGDKELFFKNLSLILNHATEASQYIILGGDLNIDLHSNSIETQILLDIFDSFQLTNKNRDPTRVFINKNNVCSESTIDYLVTSFPPECFTSSTSNPNLSDHMANVMTIRRQTSTPHVRSSTINKSRCLSTANLDDLKGQLAATDWGDLYSYSDKVDEFFCKFMEIFFWCLNSTCPVLARTARASHSQHVPWITPDIIKRGQQLKDQFHLMRLLNSNSAKSMYLENKKLYKAQISKSKKEYYSKLINTSENKSRTLWKLVNDSRGISKAKSQISLSYEGRRITEPLDVANVFVDYFSTVGDKLSKQHFNSSSKITSTSSPIANRTMYFEPVNVAEIKSTISKLKKQSAAGADGIPVKIIKHVCDEIAEPLVHLINMSINKGVFPAMLKLATVIPVYKKGDPHMVENYRPIALLSAFSKVMEKIVFNRITTFTTKFNILVDSQHGFRPGRSTESASVKLFDHISEELDKEKYVAALFFDLQRAFDTVDIGIVSSKLYNLGIRGPLLKWITCFLSERQLAVRTEGLISQKRDINLGVVQGSVLGPLIFLLFINDLPLHIKNGFVINFADDTTIVVSTTSPDNVINLINRACDELKQWCKSNRLILNESKTTCVYFRKCGNLPNLPNKSESVKSLGCNVDSNLTWAAQVDSVCKKLNSAYYLILRLRSTLDYDNLVKIYYAVAYPYMTYCVIIWGASTTWKRIFILQKRILRLIFNVGPGTSCKQLFRVNNILTFPCLLIYKTASYIFNNISDYRTNGDFHNYYTRFGPMLSVPRHRTALFEKSPSYRGIKMFNALPSDIQNSQSLSNFKTKLKKYLISSCFYSVEDFYEA